MRINDRLAYEYVVHWVDEDLAKSNAGPKRHIRQKGEEDSVGQTVIEDGLDVESVFVIDLRRPNEKGITKMCRPTRDARAR